MIRELRVGFKSEWKPQKNVTAWMWTWMLLFPNLPKLHLLEVDIIFFRFLDELSQITSSVTGLPIGIEAFFFHLLGS